MKQNARFSHNLALSCATGLCPMLDAIADRNIDRLPVASEPERWDVP
jgi:hypothetical protein